MPQIRHESRLIRDRITPRITPPSKVRDQGQAEPPTHVFGHVSVVHDAPSPPAQIRVHFADVAHVILSHAASAPLHVRHNAFVPARIFTSSHVSFTPLQSTRHDVACVQSIVRSSHGLPASASQSTRQASPGGHTMVLGQATVPPQSMMHRFSAHRVHASGQPASTTGPSLEGESVVASEGALPSSEPSELPSGALSRERSSMPMSTPHAKVASASELTTMCRTRTRSD